MSRIQMLIILITTVPHFVISQETNSKANLHLFNYDPPRQTFSITLKESTPKLPPELLGSYYLCSDGGVWILYQDTENYAKNGFILTQPGCRTRKGTFPIKSVWLLESGNYPEIPTANLFVERFWANPQSASVFTSDQPSIYLPIRSLIVTGSSAITFYMQEGFLGRSICLEPLPGNNIPFSGHFEYMSGAPAGNFKSFRFGCFSSNVVYSSSNYEES